MQKRRTGKVSTDIILHDILERLRKLDERLDLIEQEIAGVKKAVKTVMLVAKLLGGLVTAGIAIWNIVMKFLPKGSHGR
jgi:hypothetical protein